MAGKLGIIGLIGFAPAGVAAAQDVPAEEIADRFQIIVTGERIARTEANTASSVVVVTGEDAERASADRLEQILLLVPNVQAGSGEEGPAIRGQDSTGQLRNLFAFLGGARPRVTLQVDGRPVSYYEFVSGAQSTWDIAQVEVFRSPQTTTQGRNSIAGAIFVNTNSPADHWEGRGRIIAGNFGTGQLSAMLSGPVVQGELAFRASGDLRIGRVSNDMTDRIDGADIDRDDYGTARFKLRYKPQELPGALLEATLAHTRSQAPQFEGVLKPFEDRRLPIPSPMIGVMKVDATSLTTRAEYEWVSGLRSTVTASHGDARLRRFGLPGLGQTRADTSDFSIEPTLHWRKGEEISALLGVHRFWMDQVQTIDITGLGIGSGIFNDTQNSMGVFGEADWWPAEGLRLTGGLRYQRDRQIRTGKVGNIALDFDRTFDAWLPKISLAYDLSGHVTAGMLVQRAYNPGGTSISLLRRAEDTFEAERLWNYEVFVRAVSTDGKARLNVNAFYSDIENAQRPQLVPVELPSGGTIYATEFANAPAARSYGLEADLSWKVRDDLNVRVGLGILETKVVRTVDPGDQSLGKPFQRSPGLTAAGALDWQPFAGLDLSMQVRHQSGYFSDDSSTPDLRIDASTVVDARAAYSYGALTAFAYARNVFDKHYLTYLFRPDFGAVGKPREAGIGLEARF